MLVVARRSIEPHNNKNNSKVQTLDNIRLASTLGSHTGIVSAPQKNLDTSDYHKKINANKRKWTLKRYAERLMPDHRTNYCMRRIGNTSDGVQLYHNPAINNAHYQNLAHCDNVWTCPVCSATIAHRRANEIQLAVNRWHGNTVMLTYTMRHKRDDDPQILVVQLRSAMRKLWKDRTGRSFRKRLGFKWSITNLDITYHERNGFHIHIHQLMFLDPAGASVNIMDDQFLGDLLNAEVSVLWQKAIRDRGGDSDLQHGFKASTGDQFVREYVAKFGHLPKDVTWTQANELALSNSKHGKPSAVIERGLHPFEILAKSGGEQNTHWAKIWARYVAFTRGKNQLTWSPHAKEFFGIDDLDDSQIIDALHKEKSDKNLVCEIPLFVWEAVLHFDKRVDLLNRCIKFEGDQYKITSYLSRLWQQYNKKRARDGLPDMRETIYDYEFNRNRIDGEKSHDYWQQI